MRRQMMEAIRRDPGISISQLCRTMTRGWGTVKHHLNVLRRAGLVVARDTGRDCLLFPADLPMEDLAAFEALRRGRASHLAKAIAEKPGASQKDLCERLHMTRRIMRRYIGRLSEAGLVSERREAQYQRYYPGPTLDRHLPPAKDEGPKNDPAIQ